MHTDRCGYPTLASLVFLVQAVDGPVSLDGVTIVLEPARNGQPAAERPWHSVSRSCTAATSASSAATRAARSPVPFAGRTNGGSSATAADCGSALSSRAVHPLGNGC
jgi:hypothetical protein